jgi:hypothetical protein
VDELTKRLVEEDMKLNEPSARFADIIRSSKLLNLPKPE